MPINFAHRHVDSCLVAVSGDGPLSDRDFDQFVQALDRDGVTRYLSCSTGETIVSGPQRKRTAEILRRRGTRTALINESKATRGFVAAGRFLGLVEMRVFSRAELDAALSYLGVANTRAVREAVGACCSELNEPAVL